MKKAFVILALCAILLVSCNESKTDPADTTAGGSVTATEGAEIDISAIAAEAVEDISFSVELEELSSDAVAYLYPELPENTDAVVYSTGGAGAEELAVFFTEDVTSLFAALDTHKTEQRNLYASYKPEDVSKIESSVIFQYGKYVVFCVSEDNKSARTVIEGLFH